MTRIHVALSAPALIGPLPQPFMRPQPQKEESAIASCPWKRGGV